MPNLTNSPSLHSKIVQSILVFSILILLITSLSIINLADSHGNETIASETLAWANILGKNSRRFLENDNDNSQNKLKNELKELITSPIINRIHVYRLNEDGDIVFFSSYNKNHKFPAISEKIADIPKLKTIQYQEEHVELIVEIKQEQQLLGYLFIQSSLLKNISFIEKLTYIMLGFFAFIHHRFSCYISMAIS
jgi:hypothetical protein